MLIKKLLTVTEFCTQNDIDLSFIHSLNENGLIEIVSKKGVEYIDLSQIMHLERFVRLYYDLDINIEGIETINHLLCHINAFQEEIISLKNQLSVYETDF